MTDGGRSFDFLRDATTDERAAFEGLPSRIALPAGTKLYRFLTPASNHVLPAKWWYPGDTFTALLRLASAAHCSLAEAARSRLAVTVAWNRDMSHLCVVLTKVPIEAWRGAAKYQPASKANREVLLLGGFQQLFIPDLTLSASGLTSAVADLVYYGPPPLGGV